MSIVNQIDRFLELHFSKTAWTNAKEQADALYDDHYRATVRNNSIIMGNLTALDALEQTKQEETITFNRNTQEYEQLQNSIRDYMRDKNIQVISDIPYLHAYRLLHLQLEPNVLSVRNQ